MGFLLLLPFFLIRFRLMARLNPRALPQAAHFPPLNKGKKAAYWVYQLSTAAILLCILFGKVAALHACWLLCPLPKKAPERGF